MVQLLKGLVRSIRPRQALKNLSLFAPLIFTGFLFDSEKFSITLWCAFIFTILTSSVYLLNDIIDLPHDRLHPYKKFRPIASGEVPVPVALFLALVGFLVSLSLAYAHNPFFFLVLLTYFSLQVVYMFILKNIPILDIISIAAGFILRVYAGAVAINVHMNVWFLLCVVSLALFLAAGKRRAEMVSLSGIAGKTRTSLSFYSPDLLDAYLSMFANSAWLSYALFTFFASPLGITNRLPFLTDLPLALAGINKWMMATVPFVVYGVMRYMRIVYQSNKAEAPERVLLSDKPLLLSVFIWGILVILILYGVS